MRQPFNNLLDNAFYRFDAHHVDVTVAYASSRTRCVDDLSVTYIDRDVAAVTSVIVADNVTGLDITSRNTDA